MLMGIYDILFLYIVFTNAAVVRPALISPSSTARCLPSTVSHDVFVSPPPHPDLVKRANAPYYCTGVMANSQCPTVNGVAGDCVVVSSTGQCCYESNINNCTPGSGCRDFTAGCGVACCTEAFPYCNTEVVPGDAVYAHCERTRNPTYTNSYYVNGTPPLGILTATRTPPGSGSGSATGTPGATASTTPKATSTSTTSSTPTSTSSSSSTTLSNGAIAGIAIGGAAGVGIMALCAFLFFAKPGTDTDVSAHPVTRVEYTQREHLQQYAPSAYNASEDPYANKEDSNNGDAPIAEAPGDTVQQTWELPADPN